MAGRGREAGYLTKQLSSHGNQGRGIPGPPSPAREVATAGALSRVTSQWRGEICTQGLTKVRAKAALLARSRYGQELGVFQNNTVKFFNRPINTFVFLSLSSAVRRAAFTHPLLPDLCLGCLRVKGQLLLELETLHFTHNTSRTEKN